MTIRRCAIVWLGCLLLAACASRSPATRTSMPSVAASTDRLAYLPALQGDYFRLHSKAVGRDYHIYVRLPEGYDPASAKRYPVVYVLDGDALFPLLAPTHLFLHYDEKLPEAIIVGIAYGGFERGVSNFRDVDYTIRLADSPPEHGGAPAFLRFLQEELLPRVESRHAVDTSRRVLLGQSLGGNFVLWSAQQAPDLFWGRIASNPGKAVGDPAYFAAPGASQRDDLRVIVASSSRDTDSRRSAARAWSEAWRSNRDAPWLVQLLPVEGTHAATIGEIYRRAMLALFRKEIEAARSAAGNTH